MMKTTYFFLCRHIKYIWEVEQQQYIYVGVGIWLHSNEFPNHSLRVYGTMIEFPKGFIQHFALH